nr:hypothetical protein [Solirubrobacterales bacterium]
AQYELGSDVAFKDAPLVGTHNSFNSVAEMGPGLPELKSNQDETLAAQLDFGVRELELDLHREPNGDGSDDRPVVCHAVPDVGCIAVHDLKPFLGEISTWLARPENSAQVVLLYLEDGLDNLGLHNSAAKQIDKELGDYLFAPTGRGCREVSDDVTRDDIRAQGKQLLIVSGCGKGSAWHSIAFSWEDHHRESRPQGFEDFPACGPDYKLREYKATLIRYYEDVTRTGTGTGGADDGLTPETTAAMVRCGVDMLSFDRLEPFDGRLEGTIWSWAPEEPSTGRCALIRTGENLPFGRWVSAPCGSLAARPACRVGRKWLVGHRRLDPHKAELYCERHHAQLSVPRSGYENQLLRLAMEKAKTRSALLGYRLKRGEWTPSDARGGA